MNTLEVQKPKLVLARTMNAIKADAAKVIPTRIEVLRAGNWPADSSKGLLAITVDDLHEMVHNFDAGVCQPSAGFGLPIDFGHADWQQAAGWIKKLSVEGDVLFAEVEWSSEGLEALEGGSYKMFSPSFYPACLGSWYDYENPTITAKNVLCGGGLTNIPFFKDLTPIMASSTSQDGGKGRVMYISANYNKGEIMDLTTIKAKLPADITAEEKVFLTENKDQLTTDEQVAFGIEAPAPVEPVVVAPVVPVVTVPEVPTVNPADVAAVTASIQAGTHKLMATAEVESMKSQIKASADIITGYETERVKTSIEAHVARGAIKADQAEAWTQRVLADRTLSDVLDNLPSNEVLASELGTSAAETSAVAQINAKITAAIKDSDNKLAYGDAVSLVRKENPELAVAYDKEIKGE